MNARFWIYHPTADTFVKLTLKPGQSLNYYKWFQTDEGWSSVTERYTFDGMVYRLYATDGRDCDGRSSYQQDDCCAVENLASKAPYDGTGPMLPNWTNLTEAHRDYAAEAMNY